MTTLSDPQVLDPQLKHPKFRVAFVNTHPIQYFAPLYRSLNNEGGFDVTGIYFSDFSLRGALDPGFGREVKWDIDLLDGYEVNFMGRAARSRKLSGFFSMVVPEVWAAIRKGNFDAVVVHGHYVAGHHVAISAALASGALVFARGDTNGFRERRGLKARFRKEILTRFYQRFDGVLSIGTANDEHYRTMGVCDERIFRVPFAVDNARFSAPTNENQMLRGHLRSKFGLDPDLPTICFAAKLAPGKNAGDLLEAYSKLIATGAKVQLALAGTGELDEKLRNHASKINGGHVKFLGFVNQSQLPSLFAACEIFVLPSKFEAWGLVVNEAMCAGLPIVCTRECGCSYDLVQDGLNGYIFDAGDVDALFNALSDLLANEDRRRSFGAASREIIANWSFRECANGLHQAITVARQFAKCKTSSP